MGGIFGDNLSIDSRDKMLSMSWYVIHTKPKQEQRALENLLYQGYECYLPMLPVEKMLRRELKTVVEPLFPRYLFIQLGHHFASQSWAPIRSTKGVSSLVRFGSEPARVNGMLIEQLRAREAQGSEVRSFFNTGDRVLINDGIFAGLEAVYQMRDGDCRAIVLIELLSKLTPLKIAAACLSHAN